MLKHYRKYSHDGLLILSIANAFAAFAPFAHVGHLIFHDQKYEGLVTNVSAVMISLLITGSYLLIIGFNRLIEQRSTLRIASLSPIYLLGLILNAAAIKHEYRDGSWEVVYQPEYIFYLFSFCVLIIQVDLYLLLYSLVRYSKIPRVKHVFYLASFMFFSLIPLLILRRFVQVPQNIFMLPISFFYLLFTILITFYPLVFFSSTASPYFLVVFDAKTNQIIRQYTFLQHKNEERSEKIFGQMMEFYDVLNDRMFSNDIKQIHMSSLNYYFESKAGLNYLLVLNRPSESFKLLLYELCIEVGNLIISKGFELGLDDQPNVINPIQIDNSIDKTFIHQLDRLELVKQDIDECTHHQIVNYFDKNQAIKLILHPIRLSIVQILNQHNIILRSELRKILQINSGTLQRHLDLLQGADHIGEESKFINDKPRKSIFLTPQGRADYSSFRQQMRSITKSYKFIDLR